MLRRRSKKDENGFSTIWLLGFAVLILLSAMVIFDVSRVYTEREKLTSAADAAASAGASAIDEAYLASDGKIRLDPDLAVERCKAMLVTWAASGGGAESVLDTTATNTTCQIDSVGDPSGNSIIAKASGSVEFSTLFSVLGVDSKEIVTTARARPSCSDASSC